MIDYAIILAVGTAHQSLLTYDRPHGMLPALGKPLVVRIMDRLRRAGIRKYVVVVGQNEGAIAAYLDNSWFPDVEIEFVLKLGSESLFKLLTDIVANNPKPFLITSYTSFTHAHFAERLLKGHSESANNLILSGAPTSLSRSSEYHYALIDSQKIVEIVQTPPKDKKSLTLADIAICGQEFVDILPRLVAEPSTIQGGFSLQLMNLFQRYIASNKPAFIAETAWHLQIKTDYDLLTLNKHLLDEDHDSHILSEIPNTVRILPPVRIDPQVSVGQGAKIGPYVYLESGCSVGRNAVVQNAMILQNAVVSASANVSDMIVSSRVNITT